MTIILSFSNSQKDKIVRTVTHISGMYLKEIILNTLNKFKVKPSQLYSITSDNGANMVKAVKLIEIETETVTNNEFEHKSDLDGTSDINSLDDDKSNSSIVSEADIR